MFFSYEHQTKNRLGHGQLTV